jgi:GntR family transcriptional repressor for pyruvate dehydrogenase complex
MAADLTDLKVERKPKLSENVAQSLRAQILAGDFAVGEKLPTETRMTEIFGVSRTVVREAIAALAADRLVEPRHGAGVFVLDNATLKIGAISADIGNKISQAINVLEVRMGIEIESAGLAAQRRNAAQEARVQEAFFEFERLLQAGEPTGKADFAFHREIASATNNPFYVEILDALGDRTIPCDRSLARVFRRSAVTRIPDWPAAGAYAHPAGDLGRRSAGGARRHARAPHRRTGALPQAPDRATGRLFASDAGARPHPQLLISNTIKAIMTTECTSRFAIDPTAAAAMGTDELRHNFHLTGLFVPR